MCMLTFTTLSVLSRRRHTAFSTRWRASTVPSVGSGAGTLTTAAKKTRRLESQFVGPFGKRGLSLVRLALCVFETEFGLSRPAIPCREVVGRKKIAVFGL